MNYKHILNKSVCICVCFNYIQVSQRNGNNFRKCSIGGNKEISIYQDRFKAHCL